MGTAAGAGTPVSTGVTAEVAAGSRSLVVYLHGTTQTANAAALAAKWNDLADIEGFVVEGTAT